MSLELHVVWTFWSDTFGSNTPATISLHFAQPSYELERPAWELEDLASCLGAELILAGANFLQKYPWCYTYHFQFHLFVNSTITAFVSSSLARKLPANSLSPSEKAMFFLKSSRGFGLLGKFQRNIKISINMTRVSRLYSVSCDYGFRLGLGKPIDSYWFKMSCLSCLVFICVHCFFLNMMKSYEDICSPWISRTSAEIFFS